MTEYNIYGLIYKDAFENETVAVFAAESDKEAIGMLEESLIKDKGYEYLKNRLDAKAIKTDYKASKKGIVFGYDSLSGSLMN